MLIEFDGLRATVDVPTEGAWEVLRFATTKRSKINPLPPYGGREGINLADEGASRENSQNAGLLSQAAQVRAVATEVLADGKVHTRRELSAAVRKAGLSTGNLDGALKGHFERNTNGMGNPVYRDLEAAPPAPVRPARTRAPGELGSRENPIKCGAPSTALGAIGGNGSGPGEPEP